MTHTLHRIELKTDLSADFVFLCTPSKGINTPGAAAKLEEILEILLETEPVNIGFYRSNGCGCGREQLDLHQVNLNDNSRLRCLFDSSGKMVELLRRLKDEHFGLSVAVTGELSEVVSVAREAGLDPHTVNLSLGVFGKTELLPSPEILEMTTMCGHGRISFSLVRETFEQLKTGNISIAEAMLKLDQPCTCGIVNPIRLRGILEEIASEE